MSPFSNKTYRHLFSAQIIALVGNGLATIALALLAYKLAQHHAGEILGISLTIKMVSYIFIAPIAGSIVHYLSRKKLLVAMDVLRCILVLLMPFVTAIWQIYVLMFLISACSASFTPNFQATLPDVLEDEELYTKALVFSRVAYNLESLLSPCLAALLLTVSNFEFLFYINGLCYFCSALLVLTVAVPNAHKLDQITNKFAQTTAGIKHYFSTPALRQLLARYAIIAFAGAMVIINTVVYVQHQLQLDKTHTAIAFAAFGSGALIATLLFLWLSCYCSLANITLFGAILATIALAMGISTPSWYLSLFIWLLIGIASSWVETPAGRIVTASCSQSERSQLFAAQFSLTHLCWLLSYFVCGVIGSTVGLHTIFIVLFSAACVILLFSLKT